MYKLIYIIKCLFLLVKSNPLQGLQSYPLAYQQNYVNQGQPVTNQIFDPYPQLLRQNTWPSYQNLPITYQDTPKPYYENLLVNSVPNNFVDANTRIYDQNGIDVRQYITNPRQIVPNVLNNCGSVPQEFLNRCVDNEIKLYVPTELTIPFQGNQNFGTTDEFRAGINYNDPTQNVNRTIKKNSKKRTSNHSKSVKEKEENQKRTTKSKMSKRNNKRKNNSNDKNVNKIDEKSGGRENNIFLQKLGHTSNVDINTANEGNIIKEKPEDNILNRKPKINRRSKSKGHDTTGENKIHAKDSQSYDKTLSQDVDECLDLNENCINLESRKTRNNYNSNPAQAYQQLPNMPKEFNSNIASYLNSFMPNQNFNTDLFAQNGNFPYNFDYMNQVPQQSNTNSSGSNKRRRNRRRKKRPKNNRKSTNNNESSNKTHIEDNCNNVVELLPNKPVEIKIKTKPMPNVPPVVEDIVPEKEMTVGSTEEEIIPTECNKDDIEVILEPINIIVDDTNDENVELLPVSQEYAANVYDNDIFDDYYPDFTSDNIYLSKEDQDWNFHNRHFYNPDSISRERRRYEPNDRRIHKTNRIDTSIRDKPILPIDKTIEEDKKVASIEEVKFKTPPGLDFPDFKTEMINKDKYSPKSDIKYKENIDNMYENNKMSSFSNAKSIETKSEKNFDNAVETVYARSKVVKYGAPETEEQSNKKPNEFKHVEKLSKDDKTTIVLAKSLNYPIGYK